MGKTILCQRYSIYINEESALSKTISQLSPSKVFVLVDENTEMFCLYKIIDQLPNDHIVIRISAGEEHKNIYSCNQVWNQLMQGGADRASLVINLGGGVIGDLGGFCASTYMRGIRFLQIPTTLLSQVDASVGGKLGVDFNGVKNIIGVFQEPEAVVILTEFLSTLPYKELLSGYAELLKHGLIANHKIWDELSRKDDITSLDFDQLVYESVLIKRNITENDPTEKGLRKVLNFGHTIGHAIETLSFETDQPLLHGEAIAIGIVTESYLSYKKGFITEEEYNNIKLRITQLYGNKYKSMPDFEAVLAIMKHDKKNINGQIMFSLLDNIGSAVYDQVIDDELVELALEEYKQ